MKRNIFSIMTIIVLLFQCVIYLSSCDNSIHGYEDNKMHKNNNSGRIDDYNYTIPVDSALEYLSAYFSAETNYDSSTRTENRRIVSKISPIKYKINKSRASTCDWDCDTVLYIANFENNEGYAILAADERIKEKVLVVTDEGHLSEETVNAVMNNNNNDSNRLIITDFPTSGPGFFTTPETGDEIFMNPNTVSLYIENEQDTLIGNFNLDNEGAVTDGSLDLIPPYGQEYTTPELLTTSLCVDYALNEINNFNTFQPGIDGTIDQNGDIDPLVRPEYITSDWSITEKVLPLLTNVRRWHQNSPFNDLYPEKRRYLFFGCKRKAPSGCFPLAIAKIQTLFGWPETFIHDGYLINWAALRRSYNTNEGKLSAAHLLRKISSASDSWYFYQGTFTFPDKATSYMRSVGIREAHSRYYSFERVKNMLDNGRPLIIYSMPGVNVFKSHCWNIDGYKIQKRNVRINYYKENVLIKSETRVDNWEMVHCDFGWGGPANGYYVSGVFNLADYRAELDNGSSHTSTTNYNTFIRLITYENPL